MAVERDIRADGGHGEVKFTDATRPVGRVPAPGRVGTQAISAWERGASADPV
jgi:hypothetical protein